MRILDVYSQFDITPVKARGTYVWDKKGKSYLDFYGGHGVISIGHNHPVWKARLIKQMDCISYYSNALKNPLQEDLAWELGKSTGYTTHQLFMCNSGAEANENALKIAGLHTGRKKVVSFKGSFHGRTNGALAVTDNPKLQTTLTQNDHVDFLPLNDLNKVEERLKKEDVAAVIIEGIQGIAGVIEPNQEFFIGLRKLCSEYGSLLIVDEVQSGFGRSGSFFAHQATHIQADLITMAKGMGNGFPVAGVFVSKEIALSKGSLGTTFGGNHLACAAALAVIEVIKRDELEKNAQSGEHFLRNSLQDISTLKAIRGKGLMLGLEFEQPIRALQKGLLKEGILTGSSQDPHVLRLLPPLSIHAHELKLFVEILKYYLKKYEAVHQL